MHLIGEAIGVLDLAASQSERLLYAAFSREPALFIVGIDRACRNLAVSLWWGL